jgi:hypothetical protein
MCECRICTRHKYIKKIIDEKNVDSLIEEVKKSEELLLNLETDLEHYQAVFRGDWPRSIQILEKALENAKKKMG